MPGATGWSKFLSTYQSDNALDDYIKAHNITVNLPHISEHANGNAYTVLQDDWYYLPVKKDERVVQGMDFFSHVLILYGHNKNLDQFLDSQRLDFWNYGLEGLHLKSPSEDHFQFQQDGIHKDITRKGLNQVLSHAE